MIERRRARATAVCIAAIAVVAAIAIPATEVAAAPTPSDLYDVACPTATSCFAVGQVDAAPLVRHWNGSTWSAMPSPLPAGTDAGGLNAVACPSATSCFAVGLASSSAAVRGLVERMVGTKWSAATLPAPAAGSQALWESVACTGPKRCFAVGSAFPLHGGNQRPAVSAWNGTKWASKYVPGPSTVFADIADVACPSARSCVGVGNSSIGPFVVRWNGSAWKLAASPLSPSSEQILNLASVACPSTASCFAAGYIVSRTTGNSVTTAVAHWNGTTWTLTRPPRPAKRYLLGVACGSTTVCFAVGSAMDASPHRAVIQRLKANNTWSAVSAPAVPAAEWILRGVACPTAKRCVAVGSARNGTTWTALTEGWSGTRWSRG
jgi:hypothetical protein